MTENNKDISSIPSSDIAIIGMSCRFPGAKNIQEFWQNLIDGKETIRRFTPEELLSSGETESTINQANYVNARGIIEDVDLFDAHFFGFSAADAKLLDPQHRLFMECGWEALEAAGYCAEKYKDLIGVYASMAESSYLQENILKNTLSMQSTDWLQLQIANSLTTLSTQLSYRLNLKGPSVNITTACSSSLVTIIYACKALIDYDCDIAVAGASVISIPQFKGYLYQQGGIESDDGHCRAFDAQASGTVFSDGVGVVVLKRLADAIRDKDFIYATIKGWNINNDGSDKAGYTAPTVKGQARCILSAANFADIDLETLQYIETHGTGTAMGDPIEINALRMAFEAQTSKQQFCAIGSIKTNIGHADIAAGMASIIKTALMLKNQRMPAILHYKKANPAIDFSQTPFYVNDQVKPWFSDFPHPRRAGINSSGIGGTNAFLILEETPSTIASKSHTAISAQHLILLSAKTQTALDEMYTNLRNHLDRHLEPLLRHPERSEGSPSSQEMSRVARHDVDLHHDIDLHNVAYTLQVGRKDFEFRHAILCNGKQLPLELTAENSFQRKKIIAKTLKIAFMFPGQGAQYLGMCEDLYQMEPEFAQIIDQGLAQLDESLQAEVGLLLFGFDNQAQNLNRTLIVQPALFIFEYALGTFLMNLGIIPDAMVGHSVGEYVAACLSSVMDYSTALNLIQLRAQLMEMTEPGAMLALACNEADALKLIGNRPISIAACNTPTNTVISGTHAMIERMEKECTDNQIVIRRLNTSHAFHSQLMDSVLLNFMRGLEKITFQHPTIPVVSNLTGEWAQDYELTNHEYWGNHIQSTVRFADSLNLLLENDFNVFLELGPGSTLTHFIKEIANNDTKLLIRNINHYANPKRSNTTQFLTVLAELWLQGAKINWNYFNQPRSGSRIPLPTYPFQRQRFWISPSLAGAHPNPSQKQPYSQWFYEPSWKRTSVHNIIPKHFFDSPAIWVILCEPSDLNDSLQDYLLKKNHTVFTVSGDKHFVHASKYDYKIDIANKEHYQWLIQSILSTASNFPLYIINLLPFTDPARHGELDDHLTRCFYSTLFLTQSLVEQNYTQSLSMLVVGNDIFSVLGETVKPVKATVIGPCRIIPLEHKHINIKIIDISQEHADLNQALISETLYIDKHENMVAYRKHYRWVQTFTQMSLSNQTKMPLQDNSLFVLTGGFGGIALTLMQYITQHTKNPRFILLSRSDFPPQSSWDEWLNTHFPDDPIAKKILKLQALIQQGAEIHWFQINIVNKNRLDEVINTIKTQYGTITGVIHCAGNPGGGLAQFKTKEIAEKVFEPKVLGTYALCNALKNEPLDFFILCSSICSVVGELSQIDYCAANACLDAFPHANLLPNTKSVLTINWNSWQEVGMAVETDRPADISYFDRHNDITPNEGAQIFFDALQQNAVQMIISTMSLEIFAEQMQSQGVTEIEALDHLARSTILKDNNSYQPPRTEIEKQTATIWQNMFCIDKIGIQDDFYELGGHSLSALHLLNKINQHFKTSINVANFLSQTATIEQLAKLIETDSKLPTASTPSTIVIPLRATGKHSPLFFFHPVAGTIFCYAELAKHLHYDAPIYGIQDPSFQQGYLQFSSLEDMASAYIVEIKKIQPNGPYFLGGLSFGATLAVEVARQLRLAGDITAALFFFDGWAKFSAAQHIEERFKNAIEQIYQDANTTQELGSLAWQRMTLLLKYDIQSIHEPVFLYKAQTLLPEYNEIDDPYNYWKKHVTNPIHLYHVPGNHETILAEPHIQTLARLLDNMLAKIHPAISTLELSEAEHV